MVLPKKGDIIRFPRGGYSHYGIYIGNGEVIHRSGPPGGPSTVPVSAFSASGVKNEKAEIRVDKLKSVAGDSGKAEIFNFLDGEKRPYSPDEIVKRARGELGKTGYNLLFKNCEHFVTWCRYGEAVSKQVDLIKRFIAIFSPQTFIILELVEALRNATNPE